VQSSRCGEWFAVFDRPPANSHQTHRRSRTGVVLWAAMDHRELHRIINDRSTGDAFFEIFCDHLHPTDSVYIDPIFGRFEGREAIRAWLVPVMKKVGDVSFDAIEPAFFAPGEGAETETRHLGHGAVDSSFDEWMLSMHLPDGSTIPVVRGCSVRKFRDGYIVYACDYFDTHPLRSAEVQDISAQAGSTVSADDVTASQVPGSAS
jgi:limonene-1,2-epoxide hydrolase